MIEKNGELSPQLNKFLGEMKQYIQMRCSNFMDPKQVLECSFNFRPYQLRTGKLIDGQLKNGNIHKVVFKHNKDQVEFINARLVEASDAESGMGRVLSSLTNVLTMFRSAEEIT